MYIFVAISKFGPRAGWSFSGRPLHEIGGSSGGQSVTVLTQD